MNRLARCVGGDAGTNRRCNSLVCAASADACCARGKGRKKRLAHSNNTHLPTYQAPSTVEMGPPCFLGTKVSSTQYFSRFLLRTNSSPLQRRASIAGSGLAVSTPPGDCQCYHGQVDLLLGAAVIPLAATTSVDWPAAISKPVCPCTRYIARLYR